LENSEFGIPQFIANLCGNGPRAAERAIFNIVGFTTKHVGEILRANNVEGGNSREASAERQCAAEVPFFALCELGGATELMP